MIDANPMLAINLCIEDGKIKREVESGKNTKRNEQKQNRIRATDTSAHVSLKGTLHRLRVLLQPFLLLLLLLLLVPLVTRAAGAPRHREEEQALAAEGLAPRTQFQFTMTLCFPANLGACLKWGYWMNPGPDRAAMPKQALLREK